MRFFLLTFFLIHFSAAAQINVSNYIFRSKQHLGQERYSEAIDLLNDVILVRPEMYEPYFLRAISKYNLGDYKGAENDFSESISIKPNFPDALMYRGICRERLMNFTAAINDFHRALAIDANHEGALVSKGFTKALQEEYQSAIELCSRVLVINRKNEQAYLCRAWSRFKLYDLTGAIEDYTRVLALNPFNAETYTRRAMVYAFEVKYSEALNDLMKSLQLDSLNMHTLYQLAEVYKERGEENLAVDVYSRMINIGPESPVAYYERGKLLADAGEIDHAIEDYTMVVVLTGGHLYSYFNRGSLYYQQGKYSAAAEDLTRAIAIYPGFAEAYFNRSLAYSRLGMHAQATTDADRAREIKSELYAMDQLQQQQELKKLQDIGQFRGGLSRMGEGIGNVEPIADFFILPEQWVPDSLKSEALFLKSLTGQVEAEERWVAISHKGWVMPGAAQESAAMNKAMGNNPDDPLLLVRQGIIFQLMQNFELALDVYNAVLHDHPDHVIALLNRAYVLNKMLLLIDHPQSTSMPVFSSSPVSQAADNFNQIAAGLIHITKQQPDFVPAVYNLGNLHFASGNYSEAKKSYTLLIETQPPLRQAHFNLGLTLFYLSDEENACEELSRAGELGYLQAYPLIKKFCQP